MQPVDKSDREVAIQPAEKIINPSVWNRNNQADDEIDLFELLDDVVRQKWWLIGSVVACLLLAMGYLTLVTPTYKVEATLQSPTNQDLAPLDVPGVSYTLTAGQALSSVVRELSSYQSRSRYWHDSKALFGSSLLPSAGLTEEQWLEHFDSQNFNLRLPDENKAAQSAEDRYVRFSLGYAEGVNGVALAAGLLEHSLVEAKEKAVASWNAVRLAQLDKLRYELLTKRAAHKGTIETRIAKLSEAATVARSLGISKPTTLGDFAQGRQTASGSVVRMEVNNNNLPLYFMGTEALHSELDALKARGVSVKREAQASEAAVDPFADQPQDKFIDGLAQIKNQARYLENLKPDFSTLKLAQVAREPAPPYAPVKPKKLLVLGLALVLGLVLGTMLALLRAAWLKRQQLV